MIKPPTYKIKTKSIPANFNLIIEADTNVPNGALYLGSVEAAND